MTSFGEIFYYRIFQNGDTDVSSYSLNLETTRVIENDVDLFIKDYLCNFGNRKIIQEEFWHKNLVEQGGKISDDEFFLLDLPKANVSKNKDNNIDVDIKSKIVNIFDYVK